MDDRFTPRPVARWFIPAAVISLLFGLLICFGYGVHLTTDPATLAVDDRALYEVEPAWVSGAFGFTGAATAIAAILLILHRKAAQYLMALALAAVCIWFAGLLLVPELRDLLMTFEIAMALVVVAVTWTIFWFARHSRQRGWLR